MLCLYLSDFLVLMFHHQIHFRPLLNFSVLKSLFKNIIHVLLAPNIFKSSPHFLSSREYKIKKNTIICLKIGSQLSELIVTQIQKKNKHPNIVPLPFLKSVEK